MTRELHIIRGIHDSPVLGVSPNFERMLLREGELIGLLARKHGSTVYFNEGNTVNDATIYTTFLDKWSQHPLRSHPGRFAHLLRRSPGNVLWHGIHLCELLALREQGFSISYMPTEEAFDHFAYLEGKVDAHSYAVVNSLRDFPNGDHLLYGNPVFAELFVQKRDAMIFENVCRYGEQSNILFVGNAHRLEDFEKKDHDFQISSYHFDLTKRGKLKYTDAKGRKEILI